MGKVGLQLGLLPETRCCWTLKFVSCGPRGCLALFPGPAAS